MHEATQPRSARRRMLPVGFLAAALAALLAFAPMASAAPDPVASGSTALTLNKQFAKYLGTFGIKVSPIGKAKVKGKKATFPVTGGSVDPTTGKGTLTHSGGLTFKAGKKKAQVKALEVNTAKKTVTGKLGGKKVVVAKIAGVSSTRNGFGANLVAKKVKLTPAAAKALNKALGFAGGKPLPFQKNKLIGSSKSSEQPKTTTLVPGGSMTVALNQELVTKLTNAKVNIGTLTGTTTLPGNTYSFPITGGNFAPNGTAGTVQSGGGFSLAQNLSLSNGTKLDTNITLGGVWYDLQAKTLTVEVSATSTASKELNLGALGRSSVADVTIGGVIADPTTRSVAVQNSSAVLQQVSGEVLNGFVKVYAEYTKGSKELEAKALGEEAAKAGAEAEKDAAEAKVLGEEAAKLQGEGKLPEAAAKAAEAEAKKKEAEEKGALALSKKAAAEAKLSEAKPAKEQFEKANAIAGGQQLGLVSFSGQAQ